MSKLCFTSVVLVGGKSRRLGTNKALAVVGGKTILERVVMSLRPLSAEIVLVVNTEPEVALYQPRGDWRVVVDAYPDGGSLGGVYTGVGAARCPRSLVVACDMPFLNRDVLGFMMDNADQYDVVMARIGGFLEPLHAIYAASCCEPMRALLQSGDRKIINLVPEVRVRYIEQEEIEHLDPRLLSFFNVNTPEDLARAESLAAEVDRL